MEIEFRSKRVNDLTAFRFNGAHSELAPLKVWLNHKIGHIRHARVCIIERIGQCELDYFGLTLGDIGSIGLLFVAAASRTTHCKVLEPNKLQYIVYDHLDNGYSYNLKVMTPKQIRISYGYEELPVVIEKPKLSINNLINQQLPLGMQLYSTRCANNTLEVLIDTKDDCTYSLGLHNFQKILAEYHSDQDKPTIISIDFSLSTPHYPNRQRYYVVFKFTTN